MFTEDEITDYIAAEKDTHLTCQATDNVVVDDFKTDFQDRIMKVMGKLVAICNLHGIHQDAGPSKKFILVGERRDSPGEHVICLCAVVVKDGQVTVCYLRGFIT